MYRLASGNYLEVSREQYPVNPREYATGLGKFYLFQKGVHMDESPDLGNLNDFCRKYGLSHPKFHNTNVGPCTADSSKGILLIPIRSFNYHLYHFGNPTYPCDNYFDRAAYGAAVVMQDNINAAGLDVSIKEQRGLEQILEILKKELYDFNAYCHRLIYEMRIYDKDGIEIPEYHRGHYAAWVETGEGDFAISYMLKDMGILDEIHAMGDDIAENLGNIRIDYAI